MIRSLDIRRHADGSIDVDFYRRRAARQRQAGKRLAFRKAVSRVRHIVVAVIDAFRKPNVSRIRIGKATLEVRANELAACVERTSGSRH